MLIAIFQFISAILEIITAGVIGYAGWKRKIVPSIPIFLSTLSFGLWAFFAAHGNIAAEDLYYRIGYIFAISALMFLAMFADALRFETIRKRTMFIFPTLWLIGIMSEIIVGQSSIMVLSNGDALAVGVDFRILIIQYVLAILAGIWYLPAVWDVMKTAKGSRAEFAAKLLFIAAFTGLVISPLAMVGNYILMNFISSSLLYITKGFATYVITGFSLVIDAFAVIKNPYILFGTSSQPRKIIVSRLSGEPIYSYSFPRYTSEKSITTSILAAAGLSSVHSFLSTLFGKEIQINEIHLKDRVMLIRIIDDLMFVLITNRSTFRDSFRSFIDTFLKNYKVSELNEIEDNQINSVVNNVFKYVFEISPMT